MNTESIVASGRIIQLVEQHFEDKGRPVTFEIARRAPGVRLLIPTSDGSSLLLTREYRRELNAYDYRLPGGKVYDKLADYVEALRRNDSIEKFAAKKAIGEGAEEAGLTITDVLLYKKSICGATIEWDLYFFEVTDYVDTGVQALEDGEDITVNWFPASFAFQMALAGQMHDDRSAAVFMQWLYGRGVRP
jgi:ADP-ribose pyrophosphatase